MKQVWKILPWMFVALFGAEIVAVVLPKKDGVFHVREFARLPVLLNGRVQPFDSVARNSLLELRSTGDVPPIFSWMYFQLHPLARLRSRIFSVRSARVIDVSLILGRWIAGALEKVRDLALGASADAL